MVTTYNPSRWGQDRGLGASAGAEEELFLKIWSGEILTAFERHSVTNDKVRTRSISGAKSATFPVIGAASASYHTPGSSLITSTSPEYKSTPKAAEKVITIDGILQSSILISDIDEAMSYYDVRGPYAREVGWSLAKEFDIHTLQTIIVGAEKTATFTGDKSDWGSTQTRVIVEPNFSNANGGSGMVIGDIKTTIREVAERMDADDVPETGRHFAVETDTYYTLGGDTDVVNSDYSRRGTGGDLALGGSAPSLMYQGLSIHKTNRLADVRALGSTTYTPHLQQLGTDYTSDDFNHTVGVAWQEDWAVGVVKLKELGLQSSYMLDYLATLMVAGFSCGHGVLHESACYSVVDVV